MATDEDPAAADTPPDAPGPTANGVPEPVPTSPNFGSGPPPAPAIGPAPAMFAAAAAGPSLAASGAVAVPIAAGPVLVATATRPPGVAETVGGALDLALAASSRVRRASIYIGIVLLAVAGPAVILFMALVRNLGGFDNAVELFSQGAIAPADRAATTMFGLATLVAFIGLIAVSVEAQIMATAIVGGAASGRRIGLRRGLRLSRKVFWSVVGAAFLVGIVDRVVTIVTAAIVAGSTGETEASTIVEIAASGLATMPFGFYQAGIILGGVGPIEALRRSVRIARTRWRLALVVALAGIALSYIEVFALGAGLDVVLRFAEAAGLGVEGTVPVATATVVLVLVCIVAVGSLVVTIAALVAAPQVFVFVKMTGYSAGLDRAMAPAGEVSPKRPRLLTLPMIGLIALGMVVAILGLASL
jgi:hypothetical protein